MRRQSNGKIRRTEAEWTKILEQHERSGLSAAAFCRRQKLSKNTFAKWKRALAEDRGTAEAHFIELTPERAVDGEATGARFELQLPGGVTLRWSA